MSGVKIEGDLTGYTASVDTSHNLCVMLPAASTSSLATPLGAGLGLSENDPGVITGTPYLASPDTDSDYRLRIAPEIGLDLEVFNYLAQNTGKHTYANSTMTAAWGVGALTTNSGGATTAGQGLTFGTYAFFPLLLTSELYCEVEGSFTAAYATATNTTIDFGLFLRGAATAYAPADGVYFRLTSAGMAGVVNYNGSEVATSTFAFTYRINQKYKFAITVTPRKVQFWIDDVLYASVMTPAANGQPFAAASLPFSLRHAIVGSNAAAAISFQLSDYGVSTGGMPLNRGMDEYGNGAYGSYQGLSGGVMGSLANYANSANPTALVPTNTTAAAGSLGLGGQTWETDTVAVTTDCIIMSYQNPAATASVQGRRLRINGVSISSFIQTALTTPAYVAQWSLAFGHTAVSLATGEAAATKAPRRIALGIQPVVTTGVSTLLATVTQRFQNSIYVEPGQFVAVVKKKVGTASAAGVIGHVVTYDYSWE